MQPALERSLGAGLKRGLVDYWPCHEASGTRFSALGKNNMTDNNTVTQAQGKPIWAASFVAVNSEYLSTPSNAELQAGDVDWTACGWAKLSTLVTGTVVAKDTQAAPNREFTVGYIAGTARFRVLVFNSGGSNNMLNADNFGAPATGVWHFLRAYHDNGANQIGIVVNDLDGDVMTLTVVPSVGTHPFEIGRILGGQFWNGALAEVGWWKRLLTVQEHLWLYNKGAGRTYPFDGRPGPLLARAV